MPTNDSAAAEQRKFWRDIALIGILPTVVLLGLAVWLIDWQPKFEAPDGSDVFAVAEGTWDWTTAPADSFCVAKRHTITFAPDRQTMTIALSEPWIDEVGATRQVAVYDLSESSRRHLRGKIRGETRLTQTGEPVAWNLVLTSESSYKWQQTDWLPFNYTAAIERCPTGTPPVILAGDSAVGS